MIIRNNKLHGIEQQLLLHDLKIPLKKWALFWSDSISEDKKHMKQQNNNEHLRWRQITTMKNATDRMMTNDNNDNDGNDKW